MIGVNISLALISALAIFANFIVIILIGKKSDFRKKTNSSLMIALAVQDILTAIGLCIIPGFVLTKDTYRLPENRIMQDLYCWIIWSRYITFALAITSVYTCLMLAIDRWVAVFKPLFYRSFSRSKKVISSMLIFPWLVGFSFEINTASHATYYMNNNNNICKWKDDGVSLTGKAMTFVTFTGKLMCYQFYLVKYWQ